MSIYSPYLNNSNHQEHSTSNNYNNHQVKKINYPGHFTKETKTIDVSRNGYGVSSALRHSGSEIMTKSVMVNISDYGSPPTRVQL